MRDSRDDGRCRQQRKRWSNAQNLWIAGKGRTFPVDRVGLEQGRRSRVGREGTPGADCSSRGWAAARGPDATFKVSQVCKHLPGASAGAIANALDKLVADGTAKQVADKPATYQAE